MTIRKILIGLLSSSFLQAVAWGFNSAGVARRHRHGTTSLSMGLVSTVNRIRDSVLSKDRRYETIDFVDVIVGIVSCTLLFLVLLLLQLF